MSSYHYANFMVPANELLTCYVTPLSFNPATGLYSPVSMTGIGQDGLLSGYIDGWEPVIRQGTRRIQTPNRRFVNHIPTTLDHSVTFKEILRNGNQDYYGSDSSLGGSLLVAAAAQSPYLKFQISTGRTSGVGWTEIFAGVWTSLMTPIDGDDIPIFTLEMSPIDLGLNDPSGSMAGSVLYYSQSYSAPFLPT